MNKKIFQLAILMVLAALMFLASGLHGSYFCVAPWAGDGPVNPPPEAAAPP
jgi:hypothetical protein